MSVRFGLGTGVGLKESLLAIVAVAAGCNKPSSLNTQTSPNPITAESQTPTPSASLATQMPAVSVAPSASAPTTQTKPSECKNDKPSLVGGKETGFVVCENGLSHRLDAKVCPSLLPRKTTLPSGAQGSCKSDKDCKAKLFGHCQTNFEGVAECRYGCTKDSECEKGQICECGDPVGRCLKASCTKDTDCKDGMLCSRFDASPHCIALEYACQSTKDECSVDADCDSREKACAVVEGVRKCVVGSCVMGRPLFVESSVRLSQIWYYSQAW